jgi:hypothetical protein
MPHMDAKTWACAQLDSLAISAYCIARSSGLRSVRQEPLLALNPQVAYLYSLKVMRGRFREAEPAISESAEWSVRYARFVIKGRFKKAERTISKDSIWAYEYAIKVIKGRLPPRMHRAMESLRGDYFAEKYLNFQIESKQSPP